ncbi:MAG: histidine phosphatase family protein [Deltaproteobacteria bacterium]|nr:histidine phosphatase family protein [Deltaproteobacteria bacterium]
MGKVMSNVRFLLVRHGETTWNQESRWQGQADVPLSDAGRVQARLLAQRLLTEGRQFHAMYASDLSRAFETAEILGQTLGVPLSPDSGWREMNIGVWSGLTTAEVMARHAVEWERLRAGEDLPRGGGETFAQFQGRLIQSAQLLAQRHNGEQIVIVTHGGAVRAFLLHCRNLPTTKFREIDKIGNTGVSEVTFALEGETIIHSVNDVSHLNGAALVGETVDA